MKYLFVLLMLGLAFNSFGQNRYRIDETNWGRGRVPSPEILLLKSTNKPISGVVYIDVHQKPRQEFSLKDGKLDGLSRGWHENGWLALEKNYTDGKEEGLCRYYWGPHREVAGSFIDETGLIVDEYEEVPYANKANQLKFEVNFKDGKADGLFRAWHENGQLKEERNFNDGKEISNKCWDKDGNEEECSTFR